MKYQLCYISRYYIIVANEAISYSYQWYLVVQAFPGFKTFAPTRLAVEKRKEQRAHTTHAAAAQEPDELRRSKLLTIVLFYI
jgi:hypothetical protein